MTRWVYTGDFSWTEKITVDLTGNVMAAGTPNPGAAIVFVNSQVVQSNQYPNAIDTFLVLRNVEISSRERPLQRTPQPGWYPALALTFSALANATSTATLKFNLGGISNPQFVPSGLSNILYHLGCWLKRIFIGTPPNGVTINDISVGIKYASNQQFDDLNLTGPVTGFVNLGDYYDGGYGLQCYYPDGGGDPEIDVKIAYTSTNNTNTSVPITLYGGVVAFEWVQFDVIYADWAGVQYELGKYDNQSSPLLHITLDRKVPTPVPGGQLLTNSAGYGNLIFNLLEHTNFYNPSADFDVVLTAYLAVLLPS